MNFFSNWLKKSKPFWQHQPILIAIITAIVLMIAIWLIWILKMRAIGPLYSPLTWAPENLSIFVIPLLATTILALNIFLAERAFKKEILISYLLIASGLFIQILVLILIRFYLSVG